MAKLPQTLDGMTAPNAPTPSGSAVDFGGLQQTLQGVGHELERWDESRRRADDEVALRELETARQAYSLGAGERAAAYDGRSPGFAQAELAEFDKAVQPLLAREDLSDGVRDALTRQSRDLRTRVGAEAIGLESRARGQRAAADRDASEQATALRSYMGAMAVFDGLEDERRRSWDGASPGFAEGLLGDFRQASEMALAGQPEAIQARLRPMLQSREVQLQASAMAAEDEGRDASTLRTVADGLQGLINRAARDPAAAGRLDAEMAPILAAAPAHMREKLARETREQATVASLQGRIDDGDFETVRSEVEAGRYDWMDPGRLQALDARIKSADAVRTVEDAQAAADIAAEFEQNIRNVLMGQAPDAGLVARARELAKPESGVLSPEDVAKMETDLAAAAKVQPLMARLRTLTPQQVQAELETLRAASGDAVGARALELAGEMSRQDQARRAGDPAAWASTPVGPGDRVATEVQARLVAFTSQPSPETAQAYARATWTAQSAGGVPVLSRRLLPSATAEAWVAEVEADGAPAEALATLAQKAALFGDGFRPQVIRELSLAGLKPADLGAIMHYARSPAQMAAFARARALKPNEVLPKADDRAELDTALRTALAPHFRALSSGAAATATLDAARTQALGRIARGESVREAVAAATAPMLDGWDFQGTFAIPERQGFNVSRVRSGTREVVADLLGHGGRDLYAPPSATMTPEQSRRLYRDMVRTRAEWHNLHNETGLELVVQRPDGSGFERIRDAEGREIVRTWRQLEATGHRGGPSGRFGFN